MLNFKREIANKISKVTDIECNELMGYIEVPKEKNMGDYAFPCFRLAKTLRKAPQAIAEEINSKLKLDGSYIEKTEVVSGYLNFYIKKEEFAKTVIEEFDNKKENYGKSDFGKGKNIIVEYSSPNIAKPFHIGHLRTTLIGNALYNTYKYLGYNTIGINHLGDYGTQFGKMIEGYKKWHDEYSFEKPIEDLTDIYVRINELCKEDESVLELCRENFKKLENKEEYEVKLWETLKDLSLKEFYKIYDLLDVKFDSLNGEAFYADKMQEIIDILDNTGKLVESQGAKVIELEDKGMPPCIICKSNGSSIYATRDLAAILYRARTYDFDKCLYVVAYEQNLHFKQIFEVAKLLGIDEKYTNGLEHVSYGMVHLKSGKMSTREGNVVKVEDLLNEAVQRAGKILEEKNPNIENKEDIAKKVGLGAVIFNDLANSRIKDEIFDWDTILNFQGETGPYIQYIFVRTKSVLENAGYVPNVDEIDIQELLNEETIDVIKNIYNFEDVLKSVTEKNEPYLLSRYLIDLSKNFSTFYNNHKILVEDKNQANARIYLTYMVNTVLEKGANLLGIKMPDKM